MMTLRQWVLACAKTLGLECKEPDVWPKDGLSLLVSHSQASEALNKLFAAQFNLALSLTEGLYAMLYLNMPVNLKTCSLLVERLRQIFGADRSFDLYFTNLILNFSLSDQIDRIALIHDRHLVALQAELEQLRAVNVQSEAPEDWWHAIR